MNLLNTNYLTYSCATRNFFGETFIATEAFWSNLTRIFSAFFANPVISEEDILGLEFYKIILRMKYLPVMYNYEH